MLNSKMGKIDSKMSFVDLNPWHTLYIKYEYKFDLISPISDEFSFRFCKKGIIKWNEKDPEQEYRGKSFPLRVLLLQWSKIIYFANACCSSFHFTFQISQLCNTAKKYQLVPFWRHLSIVLYLKCTDLLFSASLMPKSSYLYWQLNRHTIIKHQISCLNFLIIYFEKRSNF